MFNILSPPLNLHKTKQMERCIVCGSTKKIEYIKLNNDTRRPCCNGCCSHYVNASEQKCNLMIKNEYKLPLVDDIKHTNIPIVLINLIIEYLPRTDAHHFTIFNQETYNKIKSLSYRSVTCQAAFNGRNFLHIKNPIISYPGKEFCNEIINYIRYHHPLSPFLDIKKNHILDEVKSIEDEIIYYELRSSTRRMKPKIFDAKNRLKKLLESTDYAFATWK